MMIPIAGWVAPFGYPRIKACSRLPMAFRSVPRPSSPPGAKASTECPSLALQTNASHPSSDLDQTPNVETSGIRSDCHSNNWPPSITQHLHNAPEPCRHRPRDDPWPGLAAAPQSLPVRQITGHRDGQNPGHSPRPAHASPKPPEPSCAPRSAPEPDSPK